MDRVLLINILLALAWSLLTGVFTPLNLLLGFVLSFIVLTLVGPALGMQMAYLEKVRRIPGFMLFFLKELTLANLRVTRQAMGPRLTARPGIVAIPLDAAKGVEITLLANMITLTPGTLSVDVSDDRKTLYVHAIDVDEAKSFRKSIKETLEKPLLEILR